MAEQAHKSSRERAALYRRHNHYRLRRARGASVATVGTRSSIGQPATNSPSLLVFDGGTLRYMGTDATPTTDRGFTINNGKTAIIDVANATTNLTLSGSSVGGGGTSGGLTKAGLGTLTLGAGIDSCLHGSDNC